MVPSVCGEWAAVVYKSAVVGSTRCSLAEGLAGNPNFVLLLGDSTATRGRVETIGLAGMSGNDGNSLEEEWGDWSY